MPLSYDPLFEIDKTWAGLNAEHLNYFQILYDNFIDTTFARKFVYSDMPGYGRLWDIWPTPE